MNSNLTDMEVYAIESIVSNEYTGNNYHLPSHTEPYADAAEDMMPFADNLDESGAKHGEKVTGRQWSGVISSLVKKGFVNSWNSGGDDLVMVTESGWKAYQSWAAINIK